MALFAPVDNAHHQIKTVCHLLQGYQILELGYDVVLHAIYASQTDASGAGGIHGVQDVRGGSSNSLHDLLNKILVPENLN